MCIRDSRVDARRLDIGSTLGFIKANILLGLERTDLQGDLAAFLLAEAETIRKAAHPGKT